jgi:hypothetical protein
VALQEAGRGAALRGARQACPRAAALLFAAETAWQSRRSEEAGRWAEQGVALARDAGAAETLPRLLSLAATLVNLRGEYAKANAYLEEATRLAPEAGEAPAEEIPRGGKLVVGLANPVRSLTPATLEITEELEIVANVFETLLATDGRGNLTPALCEKWQVLEAGRAFLLNLRRGVSFSDGSPLAARDVKASIEACIALRDRDMPPAFAALQGSAEHREGRSATVEGVVLRGDDMLELRLKEPLPIYPALLTDQRTAIARGLPGSEVLGTGPFRSTARRRGSSSSATPATGVPVCRGSRRSSSGPASRRRPWRAASAPARSTSRATSCRRTSRRSCATRASATGWSRLPRATPTSCCSTAAAAPSYATTPCAARSPPSCARAISCGGRSGASPLRPCA